MRVSMGTDHGGFELKEDLKARLVAAGHDVIDFGTDSDESVDFSDFVAPAARAVAAGEAERGVVLCGSGAGASIAAGKITGVRAATIHDVYTAHQAVEHDGLNVLAMGGRVVGPELAWEIVETFLGAEFSGDERHIRRVEKLNELDRQRS
ncbi:MAG: RpiB/LacA/LacB family sugar-phosphate isomerase [Actinomycetota bacterium]|nr:RpiB/LacA/LacB family sugar-phosphate isomerase [Actinomycetota bacterium]